ncbi:hypothetical protein L6452_14638 [Arctium lappa]|uniref:Uncharacterized protein n=1 Tax=Arctium lappa TaxID=4217 RepID=A0ACB9CLM4_ARCLA|nr:hypothetical protein L6452_14638 [Arctium lappa]
MFLGSFWLTYKYDTASHQVSASILSSEEHPDLTFGVEDVRSILRIPEYETYAPFPAVREHDEVVATLNYIHEGKSKGSGTLLRKNMGAIWNFFFSHLLYCISHKTSGWDQSLTFITRLAHALIFMQHIDFAQVIFDSIVTAISPPRTHNVALPRFLSLIINKKLVGPLRVDVDLSEPSVVYDLPSTQIRKQTLHKPVKPTDTPLSACMISFITSPNPIWGTFLETGTERPTLSQSSSKSVVLIPQKSTRAKSVAIKKKKATSNVTLASMTMPSKQPSESTPVITPSSKKRRGSKSPPKSRPKRLRKSFLAEPHTPSTDSQKSDEVEIPPLGPRGSTIPQATSSTLSQQDELASSPSQRSSSSHHNLTPEVAPDDSALLHEEHILPDIGSKSNTDTFLDLIFSDTTTYLKDQSTPSPPPSPIVSPPKPTSPKSITHPTEINNLTSPQLTPLKATSPKPSPKQSPESPKHKPSPKHSPNKGSHPSSPDSPLGFPPKRQPQPISRILPHDPPSPVTERAGSSAPTPLVPNSQQSHFSLPSDVFADIIDTNRQQRFLGTQFESLRNSIRDPEILASLDINNTSLAELLRLIKEQNTELLRVHSDFYRCMDAMEQDILGLRNPLSDALDVVLREVIKLIDSNTSLTLSMAALKAASDARDQELAKLRQRATDQDHVNSQLLDAISKLSAKLDTLPTEVARYCAESLDIDITDSAFTPDDHRTLNWLDRRLGRVSAKAGLSSPTRPEGEKPSEGEHITPQINLSSREETSKGAASKGEGTEVEMEVSASAENIEKEKGSSATNKEKETNNISVIEGEGTDHSLKVIEESKGETVPIKDKGKKKLTPEEAVAEEKRLKSIKIKQLADEGGINLPPPLKTMTLDRYSELAQKIAEEEAENEKGSTDMVVAQLSALEKSAKKKEEIKAMCIDWYHKALNNRRRPGKISDVKFLKPSKDCKAIRLVITRDDLNRSVERLDSLVRHGVSEWIEIMICLENSRNSLKPEVEKYITDLQTKFGTYRRTYKITHTPAEEKLIESMKSNLLPRSNTKSKSTREDVFAQMSKEGKAPNISFLDLSLPTLVPHLSTTVIRIAQIIPISAIDIYVAIGESKINRTQHEASLLMRIKIHFSEILSLSCRRLAKPSADSSSIEDPLNSANHACNTRKFRNALFKVPRSIGSIGVEKVRFSEFGGSGATVPDDCAKGHNRVA